MLPFEAVGGSVVGRDHVAIQKNNQDAFHIGHFPEALVAVVCDGCGSGEDSEVGAKLGARWVVDALLCWVFRAEWKYAKTRILENLEESIYGVAGSTGSRSKTIEHLFLFTTVAAVVTSETTYILSIGDGVFSVNGEVTILQPRAGNAPIYLAYNLTETTLKAEPGALDFNIVEIPTAQVETLIIGTDGCERIEQKQAELLPGNPNEYIGNLSQFSTPKMFENPDNVRRRLSLINRTGQKVDWDKKQIQKYHGVLNDDTTLVSIRRIPQCTHERTEPFGHSMRSLDQFELACGLAQKVFKNLPMLYGQQIIGKEKLVEIPDVVDVQSTSELLNRIRASTPSP